MVAHLYCWGRPTWTCFNLGLKQSRMMTHAKHLVDLFGYRTLTKTHEQPDRLRNAHRASRGKNRVNPKQVPVSIRRSNTRVHRNMIRYDTLEFTRALTSWRVVTHQLSLAHVTSRKYKCKEEPETKSQEAVSRGGSSNWRKGTTSLHSLFGHLPSLPLPFFPLPSLPACSFCSISRSLLRRTLLNPGRGLSIPSRVWSVATAEIAILANVEPRKGV